MENPIKMDDLGVPLFLETPIYLSSVVPMAVWTPLCIAKFEVKMSMKLLAKSES